MYSYSIATTTSKKVIYRDDFIASGFPGFQAIGNGLRAHYPVSGRDGVFRLQPPTVSSSWTNGLRFPPNSLYIDGRALTVDAEIALIHASSDATTFYFGLSDKALSELPVANGVCFVGTASDNTWRAQSFRDGATVSSVNVGAFGADAEFQQIRLRINGTTATATVGATTKTLSLGSTGYPASLMFGLMASTITNPASFLIDWVEIWR